jgi:meso-butanediol dehydrogenase / (S,S)-butanediol dehydrogenase / diacetyl reductase
MAAVREPQRSCIVTGASAGIGAATAERLVADGWRVTGIDLAPDAPAGVDLLTGDAADARLLADAVSVATGGGAVLAGLVCAAGVPPSGPWDDANHWAEVLRVDLTAPYEAIRAAWPALVAARGAVVLIGSIAGGAEGSGLSPAYAAAKAGLEGLARSFAVIGGPVGIRVNVVAPGAVDTGFDPPAFPADQRPDVPLGRMAEPPEIANVVRFLLSDEAAYVTGAVWRVDGGRTVLSPASAASRSKGQGNPAVNTRG